MKNSCRSVQKTVPSQCSNWSLTVGDGSLADSGRTSPGVSNTLPNSVKSLANVGSFSAVPALFFMSKLFITQYFLQIHSIVVFMLPIVYRRRPRSKRPDPRMKHRRCTCVDREDNGGVRPGCVPASTSATSAAPLVRANFAGLVLGCIEAKFLRK